MLFPLLLLPKGKCLLNPLSLHSRRLEVVGAKKNRRARRRHVSLARARRRHVSLARARSLLRPLLMLKSTVHFRGGSRGRVQEVRTPHPPPPEMTCGFPIQLVFCEKKTMWFIGVEVEQETSAPPPKKNPGSASAF